jgi:hypothetical protein
MTEIERIFSKIYKRIWYLKNIMQDKKELIINI